MPAIHTRASAPRALDPSDEFVGSGKERDKTENGERREEGENQLVDPEQRGRVRKRKREEGRRERGNKRERERLQWRWL